MVKTKKPGVMYRGKVQRAGVLLSLPADAEARLVKEGWCSYVESWPAGKQEENGPQTDAPQQEGSKPKQEETPESSAPDTEDTPHTDAPEETPPKQSARSRKK